MRVPEIVKEFFISVTASWYLTLETPSLQDLPPSPFRDLPPLGPPRASFRGDRGILWQDEVHHSFVPCYTRFRPSPMAGSLSWDPLPPRFTFQVSKQRLGFVACAARFHVSAPLSVHSWFCCLLSLPLFHLARGTALALLFSLPLFASSDTLAAQCLTAYFRVLKKTEGKTWTLVLQICLESKKNEKKKTEAKNRVVKTPFFDFVASATAQKQRSTWNPPFDPLVPIYIPTDRLQRGTCLLRPIQPVNRWESCYRLPTTCS